MYEIIEENKTKLIIIGVLILLTVIFLIFSKTRSTKQYVYTKESVGNFKLPYININDSNVKEVNKDLKKDYKKTMNYGYDSSYDYEYYVKDKVLYLLIKKTIQTDFSMIPEQVYESYAYSFKLKGFLSSDEVLENNGVSKDSIEKMVDKKLKKSYNTESKKGYIVPQECDYTCYKEMKKYNSVKDNVVYYMNNGHLYGYLNISNNSIYYTTDIYPNINKKFNLN